MIILKKNNIYLKDEHVKNSKREKVSSIIPFLDEPVEIEGIFTLSNFFSIIEKNAGLIEIIFSSAMGHFPLKPYLEEIKKRYKSNKDNDNIKFLRCSWVAEQFDYSEFGNIKDGHNEITIYIDVCGWGPYEEDQHGHFTPDENGPQMGGYAIEFTRLNELKRLSIILNKSFAIGQKNYEGEENIVEGIREFTIYEFFGAILSELTFCGLPDDRTEQRDRIEEDYNDIAKRITKGEKVGVSLDELKKELDDNK